MFRCLPRPRKRGTLHGLRLMLTHMPGARTKNAPSRSFTSSSSKVLGYATATERYAFSVVGVLERL
jgi:hypothetical protein